MSVSQKALAFSTHSDGMALTSIAVRQPVEYLPAIMRIQLTTAGLLLATLGAAVATGLQPASQDQPGLRWTDQRIKEVAMHVRAGRKLAPETWPNGARVAVCLSVDPDNFSIAMNAGTTNPVTSSGGEYGALDGLPSMLRLFG